MLKTRTIVSRIASTFGISILVEYVEDILSYFIMAENSELIIETVNIPHGHLCLVDSGDLGAEFTIDKNGNLLASGDSVVLDKYEMNDNGQIELEITD